MKHLNLTNEGIDIPILDTHTSGDIAANEPMYNIGIVAEKTGISRDTLRAWERRHGFPVALRTEGGHRLYSELDILRLQWVKAAVDAGMRSSVAISALQKAEDQGTFPEPPLTPPSAEVNDIPLPSSPDLTLKEYRNEIFQALLKAQGSKADDLLTNVIADYPVEHVISNVISPVFGMIGEAWENGQITIAAEHFASQRIRNHLQTWLQSSIAPLPVQPIILACAPDDLHDGSLLMFSVLLRNLRWPIANLGPMVPLEDLTHFAKEQEPSAIVMIATLEESAIALQDLAYWFPDMDEPTALPICFGGRAFSIKPELVKATPGIFLGNSIQEGAARLDEILSGRNAGRLTPH